jgi:carbon storage regulator
MLVISRKLNEKIVFPGSNIAIRVVAIKPGVVRLGIEAPREVCILRAELEQRTKQSQAEPPSGQACLERPERVARHCLKTVSMGLGLMRLQLRTGAIRDVDGALDRIQSDVQVAREHLGNRQKTLERRSKRIAAAGRFPQREVADALLAGTMS